MPESSQSGSVATPPPWLVCDCAATPPTMPTCRTEHLPSCPLWLIDLLHKRLTTLDAERVKAPEPPTFGGRTMPNVERVMFAAASLEVQALLARLLGAHDE